MSKTTTVPLTSRPLASITASARRITSKSLKNSRISSGKPWQEDAWEMFDLVGEQRFLAMTLANRMAQARWFVGTIDKNDPTAEPTPTEDEQIASVLNSIGGGPGGLAMLIQRLGVNLFIPGEGWLVGIPRRFLPETVREEASGEFEDAEDFEPDEDGMVPLSDLDWRTLSVTEVKFQGESAVMTLGEQQDETITVPVDYLWMVRVWRPHPRRSWEPDSPTRSSLPVLRELVGLTMHIGAQIDSRLAGAGLLVVPSSAARAMKLAANLPEDSPEDPFTDALILAMSTPINDRSNASAYVPLVVTAPDDATGLFQYITFAKPLDAEARNMREEAIRRLALGEDAPPELLLGTAGMNHWGAWLVQEDVIKTHIEPPLALIADALTVQFLRPVLLAQGMTREEVSNLVVWFTTEHMIIRPNQGDKAIQLQAAGLVSDETARSANGFDESDAPESPLDSGVVTPDDELRKAAGLKAIEIAQANPQLMVDPGLQALANQVYEVMAGRFGQQDEAQADQERAALEGAEAPPPSDTPGSGELPDTAGAPAEPPGFSASAGADGFTGACIVLIPKEDDPLHSASSQPAHMTVAWLGDSADLALAQREAILAQAQQIAYGTPPLVGIPESRGELGDEGADVVHIRGEGLDEWRDEVVDPTKQIGLVNAANEKFPEWTKHVTLGYPEEPGGEYDPDEHDEVTFDRLGVWMGEDRQEFPLEGNDGGFDDDGVFNVRDFIGKTVIPHIVRETAGRR